MAAEESPPPPGEQVAIFEFVDSIENDRCAINLPRKVEQIDLYGRILMNYSEASHWVSTADTLC